MLVAPFLGLVSWSSESHLTKFVNQYFFYLCCNVFTYKVKFLAYDILILGRGLHKEVIRYTRQIVLCLKYEKENICVGGSFFTFFIFLGQYKFACKYRIRQRGS